MDKAGRLYICGTPIGNLEDISLRALKVLKKVHLIAAEDTRRTRNLLNYYQIKTSLKSYHEHNERERTGELISLLKEGKDIALVSDAGMPGISDPGKVIFKAAVEEGIELIPIPGPTAAISALVVSGLRMDRFVFEGFLPRSGKERKQRLAAIKGEERTVIIYESPYRLRDTLQELLDLLAERKVAVVREISKVHEEKVYGQVEEVLSFYADQEPKGEFVIVIEGRPAPEFSKEGWEDMTVLEHLKLIMDQGVSKKKAIKEVALIRGLPKRKVYSEAVVIDYIDNDNKF
ncbi:16S rRNA (cytidine(1402)-2'-O)-methyltransferase [Iocasia frigidifontis]|uniref:Ribosomal RNA small subunit methyltransferase I n=1 Tax=Iocasia fonsfrigidae TaxID=2682810 RepID=A0A8A7KBD0_9FIRM|nr:16S rRNA (cytidine(1402)-2'-O)-methyltransferase [Iocasia fonsfrigidae]QTL96649.1 16S rRNA (cytidine(1402)-2'-O)-methyltransferase [Iocasia fonsfrigidae]